MSGMQDGISLGDWSAQGFNQGMGAQFASQIQDVTPLKLFARTLPYWSAYHNTGVSITISCDSSLGGVGIQLSFDKDSLPVSAANALVDQLMETSDLMELEVVIEKMKALGLSSDLINPIVDEAERISQDIHQRLKSEGFAT